MAVNKQSVSYMMEYLRYAIEFEKYVYIWSRAMDEANGKMQRIYQQRRALETTKTSVNNRLANLSTANEHQQNHKAQAAVRWRHKANTALVIMFVVLFILFLIGMGIGSALASVPNANFNVAKESIAPMLGFGVMAVGAVITMPICLGIFSMGKGKAARYEREANELATHKEEKRQEAFWTEQGREADNDYAVTIIEESVLSERQEQIHKSLIIAKQNLQQIYAQNVLPQKYQNLVAVATFYEYLETRRCNTIDGHGGIYDTYEKERIQLEQLHQMMQMNERLGNIEESQRRLCQEMEQANATLSVMQSSLNRIEKTNDQIAKNTAISAAADQQTAAAAQWMAWRTWANG